MQCRQCGAATRPGMAQCPNCGAQLTKQDDSSSGGYRPQQGYIPGGVSGPGSPAAPSQQPAPDQAGQRRPQGSLGRRLQQQSAASGARGEPGGPDEVHPPRRGGDEMRLPQRGAGDMYPPPQRGGGRSRPRPDERDPARGYGPPDERVRERRLPTDARRRGRGYADDDGPDRFGGDNGDDRESRDYDDDSPNEAPGWAEGRGRGTPPRRPRDRAAPPVDDASEEMIARRDEPRSGPARRRGALEPPVPAWEDADSPLDDPRAPPGLRGPNRSGPARQSRASGPPAASRGRGPARFEGDPRRGSGRYDPLPGYSDEESAVKYGEDEPEGYSEEYEARPRYPEDRRGPPSGARGPRSAPGPNRAPGRRIDGDRGGFEAYDARDSFGRAGEYGRAPGRVERDPRAMGGYNDRYADAPGYNDVAQGYPPASRGGQMGRGPRDDFDAPRAWEPPNVTNAPFGGSSFGGARGASVEKAPAKPQQGVFALAFRLLTTVIVVVGLVVVVGPELKPALGKYLPFLRSGTQTATPPPFATYTPGPTPTNLPNYKLFTSTGSGYAMDYPSPWGTSTSFDAKTNDTVNQFVQPNSATLVNVERSVSFDSATDADVLLAEVQGAQSQGTTVTEITGAATSEGVGGEVWQRHEYQATTKSGTKLHIAILVCHHLGKSYVIALISADTSFTNDDTTIFEPMLRSFRFL